MWKSELISMLSPFQETRLGHLEIIIFTGELKFSENQ